MIKDLEKGKNMYKVKCRKINKIGIKQVESNQAKRLVIWALWK